MRPGMLEGPLEPPSAAPHHAHAPHSLVSHTPSISSGASIAGGGRVRFIRLIRRRNESYGFSLRGGLEHGTGFFISHVELGSEAYLQGLRAGDQLLRVNNLCVEQAIHREVTAMVQSKSSVILKVKSAGIIPVKEHRGDPLTWLVIDDDEEEEEDHLSDHVADNYSQSIPSSASSSGHEGPHHDLQGYHHPHSQSSHRHPGSNPGPGSSSSSSGGGSSNGAAAGDNHARVIIACGGKVGLGCSICKGPTEKPGIFVQSVRPGGVAKTAGLRPGDQILACNDISFTHLEFAEAVYVLKSSPRLVLDVLRGAGLDFVAGESSGYNSSASSVAGDQTPPSSSSSDPRDSDHSVTSRLSAVSHHLTLDRSRGWREIEAEWADAEAAEKRRQLQSAQRTLKTRAQRDAHHRLSSVSGSRSLCNLSAALREEDDSEESTAFRDAASSLSYAHPAPSVSHLPPAHTTHYKPTLRSTRSSNDVTDDTSHKIALVTSADPHVNNIVVSGGPKDEKDAVSRLEQLSSPSASRSSTLSSGTSQVTVRSSSGSMGSASAETTSSPRAAESLVEKQLRELREEQRKLQEEAHRLAEERRKFEEERRRGIERTQSAPLAPLVINCSGQNLPPHLQAPPSPTSSIASGRHTTRVLIKSPPPPPPPRKNTTTLSSRPSSHHPHQVSPPASPAHSSSSSSGVGSLCGSGAPPRRCKSIGSLSASSSESTVWEDHLLPVVTTHNSSLSSSINRSNIVPPPPPPCNFRSSMPPPPPPPKPAAPLISSVHANESQMLGGVPPPPPPPPPQPNSSNQPNLAAALSRELERRNAQEAQSLNGDDETKAKVIQDKIDAFKKDKQKTVGNDPKRAQHDKLMEEFKLAHKRMFVMKSEDEEPKEEKPAPKIISHQKVTRATPTPNNLHVESKIINRMNQNLTANKKNDKNVVTNTMSVNNKSGGAMVNGSSKPGHLINDGATVVNKWKGMLNTTPAASNKTNPPTATPKESHQVPLPIPPPPPPPPPAPSVHIFQKATGKSVPKAVSKIGQSKYVNKPYKLAESAPAMSNISSPNSISQSSFYPMSPTQQYLRPSASTAGGQTQQTPMSTSFSQLPSAQNNERYGSATSKPSVLAKPPLRPTPGNSVAMDEFKPIEKTESRSTRPPNAYFEVQKGSHAKPLVSIGTYPSPNNRPAPVKMEFLPSANSANVEVNGNNRGPTPSNDKLQNELTSTLKRSNIRQRLHAQDLPPEPPTNSTEILPSGSAPNVTFTTTTIQNNNLNPNASLSSKYRGIGHDASGNNSEGGSRKECDEPESLPTGILKPSGPASSIRPLQKSISFGDVTTVGEDNWT